MLKAIECLALFITIALSQAQAYEISDFSSTYIEDRDDGPFFFTENKPINGQAPILIPLHCMYGQPSVQEFVHLPDKELLLVSYDIGTIGTTMQIAVTHLAIHDLKTNKTLYNGEIAQTTVEDYTEERNRYDLRQLYIKALKGASPEIHLFTINAKEHPYGQYLLGEYWLGNDNQRAFDHYTNSAKQDCGPAAYALAQHFYSGHAKQTIVKADPKKAFQLYKQAAEAGYHDAYLHVADHVHTRTDTAPNDQASALFWLDEAAEAGSAEAMRRIKALHLNGSKSR